MQGILRRYPVPLAVGRSRFIPLLIEQLTKELEIEQVCMGAISFEKLETVVTRKTNQGERKQFKQVWHIIIYPQMLVADQARIDGEEDRPVISCQFGVNAIRPNVQVPEIDPMYYANISSVENFSAQNRKEITAGIKISLWFLAQVFNRITTNDDETQRWFIKLTNPFLVHDIPEKPPPYNGKPMWESGHKDVFKSRDWRIIRPSTAVAASVLHPPPALLLKNKNTSLAKRGMYKLECLIGTLKCSLGGATYC